MIPEARRHRFARICAQLLVSELMALPRPRLRPLTSMQGWRSDRARSDRRGEIPRRLRSPHSAWQRMRPSRGKAQATGVLRNRAPHRVAVTRSDAQTVSRGYGYFLDFFFLDDRLDALRLPPTGFTGPFFAAIDAPIKARTGRSNTRARRSSPVPGRARPHGHPMCAGRCTCVEPSIGQAQFSPA